MFFTSINTRIKKQLDKDEGRYIHTYRSEGAEYFVFRDSEGNDWVTDERLRTKPLAAAKPPKSFDNGHEIGRATYGVPPMIRDIVAFLGFRGYGANDAVLVYKTRDVNWYVTKTSCDVEDRIRLFNDKESQWYEFPEFVLRNVRDYGSPEKLIRQHPYSMEVVDWVTKKPSTAKAPLFELLDADNLEHAAIDMLVPVMGVPGLKDHVAKKVVFNLNLLDDSSTPVFDVAVIATAVRRMEFEVSNWTLDLNKVYIRFGKNPQAIQVSALHSTVANHRFYCSEPCGTVNDEKVTRANTVPESYP